MYGSMENPTMDAVETVYVHKKFGKRQRDSDSSDHVIAISNISNCNNNETANAASKIETAPKRKRAVGRPRRGRKLVTKAKKCNPTDAQKKQEIEPTKVTAAEEPEIKETNAKRIKLDDDEKSEPVIVIDSSTDCEQNSRDAAGKVKDEYIKNVIDKELDECRAWRAEINQGFKLLYFVQRFRGAVNVLEEMNNLPFDFGEGLQEA